MGCTGDPCGSLLTTGSLMSFVLLGPGLLAGKTDGNTGGAGLGLIFLAIADLLCR